MENRNLEKALELISDLIQGSENPVLYEEYISNSEVYRLTDMIAKKLGMQVFLLTDCMINKNNEDISQYPHGGFQTLRGFLEENIK